MNFKQRLKLYLVGVFFGLIVVYFSLIKNRERNLGGWLPENRVLAQMDSTELEILPELAVCIDCLHLNRDGIKEVIKKSKVNFKESSVEDKEAPVYLLEGTLVSGEKCKLTIESSAKKSVLKDITVENKAQCNCN